MYVKQIDAPPESECHLDFDPATLRATLHRPGVQDIASPKIAEADTQPLDIEALGPNPVQVGQPFNVQPSGASAIWVRASRNIPWGSRIRLSNSILNTNIQGALATADVPISIIQRVENLPVSLVGPAGEPRSNIASLKVAEAGASPKIAEADTQPVDIEALGPNPVPSRSALQCAAERRFRNLGSCLEKHSREPRIRLGNSILNTNIQGAFATADVPISIIQRVENLPVSLVGPGGEPRSNIASLKVVQRRWYNRVLSLFPIVR